MKHMMRFRLYFFTCLAPLTLYSHALFDTELKNIKSLINEDNKALEYITDENEEINKILAEYFNNEEIMVKHTLFGQKTVIVHKDPLLKRFYFDFTIPEKPEDVSDEEYLEALKELSIYRAYLRVAVTVKNADIMSTSRP